MAELWFELVTPGSDALPTALWSLAQVLGVGSGAEMRTGGFEVFFLCMSVTVTRVVTFQNILLTQSDM